MPWLISGQLIGYLASRSLGITKPEPFPSCNPPTSTLSLNNSILLMLNLSQHPWIWIFNTQSHSARRLQTLEKAAEMHYIPYYKAFGSLLYLAVAYLIWESWRNILFCVPSPYYHLGTQAQAQARPSPSQARLWAQGWAWVFASPSLLKPGPSPGFEPKPGLAHH